MGRIMIINGSPRAPKSNSRRYAQLFSQSCPAETEYFSITKTNHLQLCQEIQRCSDLLFVFPLYADGIPATMLEFLKTLEKNVPHPKPVVSILINCGFLEPEQNDVAVKMMALFCRSCGFPMGSVLKIGSGEAILQTPFRLFVRRKIKKFASSILHQEYKSWRTTMPITKKMFLKASYRYWKTCGRRNGITEAQMATMEIEK